MQKYWKHQEQHVTFVCPTLPTLLDYVCSSQQPVLLIWQI